MLRFFSKSSPSVKTQKIGIRAQNICISKRLQSDVNKPNIVFTNANKYLPEDQKIKEFKSETADLKLLREFKQFQLEAKVNLDSIADLEEVLPKSNPTLTALYHRITLANNSVDIKYHELVTCLNCPDSELSTKFENLPNNEHFSVVGYTALKADILARLYLKFPRLPSSIAQGVVSEFLSLNNLNNVGLTKFGMDLDRKTLLDSFLNNDGKYEIFGKVRSLANIQNIKQDKEIIQVVSKEGERAPVEYKAMSKATLAIFGLLKLKANNLFDLYARDIFSVEELPVQKVFFLESSIETLDNICKTENLSKPVFKLLTETGRYSAESMFIVGVYTETGEKLGEGYGKSLIEAKKRAALDASIKYLAYSPVLANNDIAFGKGEIL
ncbi:hypothetical protein QEN19_002667 [Hanseniaspora menglaensis]